jgi:hypothetical protein
VGTGRDSAISNLPGSRLFIITPVEQPIRNSRTSSFLMKRFILIGMVLLGVATSSFAQSDDDEIELSGAVMKEVVVGILKFYFKPGRERVVYLSDSYINKSWLPRIRNVEFVLIKKISFDEDRDGFMFESITRERNIYFVNFGYGALNCGDRTGDQWSFRLS